MNLIRSLRKPVLEVNSDIDEILRPNRYLLTAVGVWPLAPNVSRSARIVSLLCFVATTLLTIVMVVGHFATAHLYWGNLDKLGDVGAFLVGYVLLLLKIIFIAIRQSDFRVVYEHVREFWRVARNREERDGIVSVVNDARFCTLVFFYVAIMEYLLLVSSALLVTVFNNLFSNGSDYTHKLPLNVWYGVDSQVSPNYELLMALQTITVLNSVVCVTGIEGTSMAMVMHVAAQFRIVGLRFKAIGREVSRGRELDYNLSSEFRWCVNHHEKVIRVFQFLDNLLGPVILFEVLTRVMQICFCGYCMVQPSSSLETIIKFSILLAISCLQIGLWCWSGEAVTRESSSIAHVIIRDVPWRIVPCAVQRDLAFVLNRAQRPSTLSAMQMQIMDLHKLTEVFNTSLSYLSVLRRFTKDTD